MTKTTSRIPSEPSNCFGDNLTLGGIDIPTCGLLTFSLLAALGVCNAQVKGPVAANLHVDNVRARLIGILTLLLLFIS